MASIFRSPCALRRAPTSHYMSNQRRLVFDRLENRNLLTAAAWTLGLELDKAFAEDLGEADKIDRLREHLEEVQGLQAVEQAEQLASPLAALGGVRAEAPLFNDPRAQGDGRAGGSVWSPMDDLFGGGSQPPGRGDSATGSSGLDAARAHRPRPARGPDRSMFADKWVDDDGNSHISETYTRDDGTRFHVHTTWWADDESTTQSVTVEHPNGSYSSDMDFTLEESEEGAPSDGHMDFTLEEADDGFLAPDRYGCEDGICIGPFMRPADIPDDLGDDTGGGRDEEAEAEERHRYVEMIFGRVPDGQPDPVDSGAGPYVGWVLGRRPPEQPTHRDMVGQPAPGPDAQPKPDENRFEQIMSIFGREEDGQPTPVP